MANTNEILHQQLTEYIEKAIAIRFSYSIPKRDAALEELSYAMVVAQTDLTSLEELLSLAIRAKATLDRTVASARMKLQEKWDTAISAVNKRAGLSEYATGKEKAAEANLATLFESRTLRQAEESASFANEAVDIIRLHYYGLDKVRQDVRKRLDLSQSEYMGTG